MITTPSATAPAPAGNRRAAPSFGRFARTAANVSLIATTLNLACFGVARAVGATLLVDPGIGPANHLVTGVDVAWKTAVPVLAGSLVVWLAAQRSRRAASGVIVLGGVLAALSIPLPLLGAHDPRTATTLLALHTIAGAAFVLIGVRTVAAATSAAGGPISLRSRR